MGVNIIPLYGKTRQAVQAEEVIIRSSSIDTSGITYNRREAIINYILDNAIVHPKCSKCDSIACSDKCWDKCEEELINWINKTATFQ
jgi:hypothetical protein